MGVSAILQPGTGTGTFCGFHSIEDPALLVKKGGRNVEFGWRKQLKLPLLQYRHALVVKASGEPVSQFRFQSLNCEISFIEILPMQATCREIRAMGIALWIDS